MKYRAQYHLHLAQSLLLVGFLMLAVWTFCQFKEINNDQGRTEYREQASSPVILLPIQLASDGLPLRETTPPQQEQAPSVDTDPPIPIEDCLALEGRYIQVVECVDQVNRRNPIHHRDRFLPNQTHTSLIIVLLAHKRANYMVHVLDALRQVQGIENTTLIISHDGYFPEIEQLVRDKVDFCRYKQIYHPFSKDLTKDPDQLNEVILKNKGILPSVRQTGPNTEQRMTAHYDILTAGEPFIADPRFTQTAAKHHYWWLWHVLFHPDSFLVDQGVVPGRQSDFDAIFLEEDHMPSFDLILQWKRLVQTRRRRCHGCLFMNLGRHYKGNEEPNLITSWNKVGMNNFDNIGLTFNRTVFGKLAALKREFCGYNDYNWDMTLFGLAKMKRLPEASLTVDVSRIKHIGACGMHANQATCDVTDAVKAFHEDMDEMLALLYEDEQQPTVLVKSEWFDKPLGQQGQPSYCEGWTDGRLWAPGMKKAKELWLSDVHRDHCLAVSDGRGWRQGYRYA